MRENSNAVSDYPTQDPRDWLVAAVVSGTFAITIIVGGALFIGAAENLETATQRATALSPIFLSASAIFTGLTIIWRGTISNREIDSDDEARLADVVEKATDKVAASRRLDEISLGVAMLETVALAPNGKFAGYALEKVAYVLVDLACRDNGKHENGTIKRIYNDAIAVFDRAAGQGRGARNRIEVNLSNFQDEDDLSVFVEPQKRPLPFFENMPVGTYRNCKFELKKDANTAFKNQRKTILEGCRFIDFDHNTSRDPLTLKLSNNTRYSRFIAVHFAELDGKINMLFGSISHRFIRCDFSDTIFRDISILRDCKFEDCHYEHGFEPKLIVDGKEIDFFDAAQEMGVEMHEVRH